MNPTFSKNLTGALKSSVNSGEALELSGFTLWLTNRVSKYDSEKNI